MASGMLGGLAGGPTIPCRLAVADRLPVADLERRYRAAGDPVERTHWQLVWLVAAGLGCAEATAVTGY